MFNALASIANVINIYNLFLHFLLIIFFIFYSVFDAGLWLLLLSISISTWASPSNSFIRRIQSLVNTRRQTCMDTIDLIFSLIISRFSALPDANASMVGDTLFSFRTLASTETVSAMKNAFVAMGLSTSPSRPQHLYGYVFFRQQRDQSIRRGFLQKSVVLLSCLPLPGLFLRIMGILGPAYFEPASSMTQSELSPRLHHSFNSTHPRTFQVDPVRNVLVLLETAFRLIIAWPDPAPGHIVDLPFSGILFQVELPFPVDMGLGGRAQLLETSGFIARKNRRKTSIAGVASPTSARPPQLSRTVMVTTDTSPVCIRDTVLPVLTAPRSPNPMGHHVSGGNESGHPMLSVPIYVCEQVLASLPCSLLFPKGFLAYQVADVMSSEGAIPPEFMQVESITTGSATSSHPQRGSGGTAAAAAGGGGMYDVDEGECFPGSSLGMMYRFFDHLDHLWTLWELVLLGEPIGKCQKCVSLNFLEYLKCCKR